MCNDGKKEAMIENVEEQLEILMGGLHLVYREKLKFVRDGVAYFKIDGVMVRAESIQRKKKETGQELPFFVIIVEPLRNRRLKLRCTMFPTNAKLFDQWPLRIDSPKDTDGRPVAFGLSDLYERRVLVEGHINVSQSGYSLIVRRLWAQFDAQELCEMWVYLGKKDTHFGNA